MPAGSRKAAPKPPPKPRKKNRKRVGPKAKVGTYAYESAPVTGMRAKKKAARRLRSLRDEARNARHGADFDEDPHVPAPLTAAVRLVRVRRSVLHGLRRAPLTRRTGWA